MIIMVKDHLLSTILRLVLLIAVVSAIKPINPHSVKPIPPREIAVFSAIKPIYPHSVKPFQPRESTSIVPSAVRGIESDGNCFYRSLSLFMFKRQDKYGCVRQNIVKYMSYREDRYSSFIDKNVDFKIYIRFHSQDKVWAEDAIVQAATDFYGFDIYITCYSECREILQVTKVKSEQNSGQHSKIWLHLSLHKHHFEIISDYSKGVSEPIYDNELRPMENQEEIESQDSDILDKLIGDDDLLQTAEHLLNTSECPFVFFTCSIPRCSYYCKKRTDMKFHLEYNHWLQDIVLETFLKKCKLTIPPNKSDFELEELKVVHSSLLADLETQSSRIPVRPPASGIFRRLSFTSAYLTSIYLPTPPTQYRSPSSTAISIRAPHTANALCQTDDVLSSLPYSILLEIIEELDFNVINALIKIIKLRRTLRTERMLLEILISWIENETNDLRRELKKVKKKWKLELNRELNCENRNENEYENYVAYDVRNFEPRLSLPDVAESRNELDDGIFERKRSRDKKKSTQTCTCTRNNRPRSRRLPRLYIYSHPITAIF